MGLNISTGWFNLESAEDWTLFLPHNPHVKVQDPCATVFGGAVIRRLLSEIMKAELLPRDDVSLEEETCLCLDKRPQQGREAQQPSTSLEKVFPQFLLQ